MEEFSELKQATVEWELKLEEKQLELKTQQEVNKAQKYDIMSSFNCW